MKKFIDGWFNIGKWISRIFAYVCAVFLVAMMLIMTYDSLRGLFFDKRITGVYEVVQLMLCILVFSSWAYTQSEHGHIHVTLFISHMGRIPRYICYAVTSLISVITMVFGCIGVYKGIVERMASGESSGTLLIPYWPFYVIELITYIILIFLLLNETVKAFAALFGNKQMAEEIESVWV